MKPVVMWILMVIAVLVVAPLVFYAGRRTQKKPAQPAEPVASATPRPAVPTDILDRLGEGIVVVNEVGTPVEANDVARDLLGLTDAAMPPRLPLNEIHPLVRNALSRGQPESGTVEVQLPYRRAISVKVAPLEDSKGAVLVLRDVTQEVRTMQIRRQFVAHASHELKSPVASLQTLAEAVEQAVEDDPDAARSLSAQLRTETQRLGHLVKQLLDLSKLEDPTTVSNRTADLSETATAQLDSLRDAVREKGLKIRDEVAPGCVVRGDAEQLALLVRNLLDNAVRYTPSGGTIDVSVARVDANISIEVSDDGIGIPLRDQARIFERFYRVDDSRSRGTGGSGLGLAIVKHVAEMHGGFVTVQSQLGEGSTFQVLLPTVIQES